MMFSSILHKFKHATRIILTYLSFETVKYQVLNTINVYYIFSGLFIFFLVI